MPKKTLKMVEGDALAVNSDEIDYPENYATVYLGD